MPEERVVVVAWIIGEPAGGDGCECRLSSSLKKMAIF